VDEKKTRLYAGLTGIISSIILCAIYVYFRKLPFFDVYLDADRRRYFLMALIFSVIGVFLYMAAKEKMEVLRLRLTLPLYVLSFLFVLGIPIILFIVNGTSSKGWEWAFSTLLIGLFPELFIAFGFLVLYGFYRFSMGMIILFCITALFYIIMFAVQLGVFGKSPGPTRLIDIIFASIIICVSVVSISFNLQNFKASSL
jgi:hypothetical protein